MDLLSMAFASYINMVSNTLSSQIIDRMGTDITSISVEHNSVVIPYSYQLWRIRKQSVCSKYLHEVSKYSECTLAAVPLFLEVCQHLQRNKVNWKQKKLKNMYCDASTSFKPTIASVQWSNKVSEIDVARTECNAAVIELMGSSDKELVKNKNMACAKYNELRGHK